jgi:hypothetical protein
MVLGAATAVASASLAAVVIANYVEWDNAADALTTVALVTAPPTLGGILALVFGRWVYGEWSERAPIMRITALYAQAAGALLAAAMAAMFLILLFAGIGPGDKRQAVACAIGMAAGFAIFFAGWMLKPGRRNRFIE